MMNISVFSIKSYPTFESAMYTLYKSGINITNTFPHLKNCIIELNCGHFVPNKLISQLVSPQFQHECECCDMGCEKCEKNTCLFVCTLCDKTITPLNSFYNVQIQGMNNWIGAFRHESSQYTVEPSEDIVRKRKQSTCPPLDYRVSDR